MAKEQNLSLNPIKISGVCGRLMCCLKYEQDTYEEIRKSMPKEGMEVMTPDGVGVVCELKIITESVKVRIKKGDSFEIKEYPATDVPRLPPQTAPRRAARKYSVRRSRRRSRILLKLRKSRNAPPARNVRRAQSVRCVLKSR